jgi:lipopolysaccharide export system permease protein
MRVAGLVPFGRLDRYVAALFAGAYATSLLLVVGLVEIFQVASNLDFFEPWPDGRSAPTALIVRFYLLDVPFQFLQVAPFVTVCAGLFAVSKLAKKNEIVAAFNAGVSARRLFAPIFAGGAVAAILMFGLRETATARLGEERDALRQLLDDHVDERVIEDVWLRDVAGNFVHFGQYLPDRRLALGVETTARRGPTLRLTSAARAEFDEPSGRWLVVDGRLREETGDVSSERRTAWLEDFSFTPRDVLLTIKGFERPLELSLAEVDSLARRDPDNLAYQTLMQSHLTFPLANLVLLAVALPFLLGRERGRNLEGLVLASLTCVFYFAVDFICRSLGMQGAIPPLLASWLPLVAFGSFGVVQLESVRS